ncbi:MAG: hypothetical protein NZ700_16750 [Gemmataceae bacterium]|nr:hypothetical protein [Gemmataceae bacterium]MDW8264399.1 hypothetical protein [Gemmataceae bacterium]
MLERSVHQLLPLFRRSPTDLRPREACDLLITLNQAAVWLLRDEVLTRLRDEYPLNVTTPPPLPDVAGSCCVVYAVDDPESFPLLRPAFAVPLQWRRGESVDCGLPKRLHNLAERVKGHLDVKASWSLHRLPPFDHLDLSGLDELLSHESGWASVAAALLLLLHGGKPRPDVWATGAWDQNTYLQPVTGLSAKVDLARQWRINRLFVPEVQLGAVKASGLELLPLHTGRRNPREALRSYLIALEAPPPRTATREERCNYYMRLPADSAERNAYYRDNLLPDIIAECRSRLIAPHDGWSPSHLITLVSKNPELIELSAQALGVRCCLLLYADDATGGGEMKRLADEAAANLRTIGLEAVVAEFRHGPDMAPTMWAPIETFCRNVTPDALVFDATPGTKLMTLCIERLARQFFPSSWLIYLHHFIRQNRVEPFSERLVCWRADDPRGPFGDFPGSPAAGDADGAHRLSRP